jgi:alanyl-tRNA synthetase
MSSLYGEIARRSGDTQFLGYETTTADGKVIAILRDGLEYDELEAVPEIELREEASAEAELVLDQTPFYAEGAARWATKA